MSRRRHPAPPPEPEPPSSPAAPPHRVSQLSHYDLAVYGDSVALGAIPDLAATFRSVTNNATEGVQSWTLLPRLTADAASGRLGHDVVLIHTGDNGIVSGSQLAAALDALGDSARVIVAVPYVPRQWQSDNRATIQSVVGDYDNVALMPWDAAAQHHPDYLWDDAVHLTPSGERVYASMVANAAVTP